MLLPDLIIEPLCADFFASSIDDFHHFYLQFSQRFSIHGMMEEEGNVLKPHQEIAALSLEEKRFLLAVERGDVASTRR